MTWIAFIDETGDHGLNNIDPASPMFGLTAAIYKKDTYINRDLPAITALKHRFWNHEGVILRSYDIKKNLGPFSFCQEAARKQELYDALSAHVRGSSVRFIAAVIDKPRHKEQYIDPANSYFLAAQFVLERIFMMAGAGVTLVIESRGRREDGELAEWCQRVIDGENYGRNKLGCSMHFAKKSQNVGGLQVADLACQPITHFVSNPKTQRPDWLAVRSRIRSDWRGQFIGRGLKIFP
jgi:hypothetical protein